MEVGWIHLDTDTDVAIAWLVGLGVPELTEPRLRAVLPETTGSTARVSTEGTVRRVTATAVAVQRSTRAPSLSDQRVDVLASNHWVVTLGESPASTSNAPAHQTLGAVDAIEGAIETTGAGLALQVVLALAEGYAAAARDLASHVADDSQSAAGRSALLQCLNDLESDVSRLRRRGHDEATAWFAPTGGTETAQGIAGVLDETLHRIRALRDEAGRRADDEATSKARRRSDAWQLVLGVIAVVLLGPSLVAGVLDALPGWQPVVRRGTVFIGLSLLSGGALLLLVYGLPAIMLRRFGRGEALALAAALLLGVGGLLLALPLAPGMDEAPPTIGVSCPSSRLEANARAVATVSASDADSRLAEDPSGVVLLDTSQVGSVHRVFRAIDDFGRAASVSCDYLVVRR